MDRLETRGRTRRGRSGYGRRRALVNACLAVALAAMARPARAARARLLLFGDSLTAGYGLPAQDALPAQLQRALDAAGIDAEVVNAGVSGDTSAGGAARIDWTIGDAPPSHAIVALGANDGLRGLPPERMEANLDRILSRLAARGTRVLVAGMVAPPNLGRDYAERFAAVFPAVAARHGAALMPFLLEGVAGRPELNQQDGIHPNREGVAAVVAGLVPHVRRLLAP